MLPDIAVMIIYLVVIILIGLKFSKADNIKDYFLGDRSIPWFVACFSIVATETSTLTFLSIPGLAYIKGVGFLQIAIGFLLGRILISVILLPRYFEGNLETVYEFLQNRFSPFSRKAIAVIFHVTRLLADSVRLFAAAIPLSVLTGIDYRLSVLLIGAATFIYTYYGGIKSVVVVDSIQLCLYLTCSIIGIYIISDIMNQPIISIFKMIPQEKLKIFSTGFETGQAGLLNSYNIFSGIIGGIFLSFASHGTDHIIVQRILSCKDLKSAKKAVVFSGIFVIIQFALFLLLGLFIMVLMENAPFNKPDEIMPFFIIKYLPPGIRGLMLAGIFAAAMSTLSSSINSLSASTSIDILDIQSRKISDKEKIKSSRLISLIWTIVIIAISTLLTNNKSPLVELGLGIASITYGGMLGIFMIGSFTKKINEKSALSGVFLSIAGVLVIKYFKVFWPWYVPVGFIISYSSAFLFNKFFKTISE